jgi:argininosuccinate lyase
LIWSTDEYGFVRLPDAFTTGSSLMPQKRNPDVLELGRGRCRELRGLASLLAHLAGGLPSSYHRDQQLLKGPFLEITTKGQELFEIVARLVAEIQIDPKACAKACTRELHAAREASRLAVGGIPFRDAYKTVAKQLQDNTYAPATTIADAGDAASLGLAELAGELCAIERWLADRQQFLATTSERLFDWK